MGERHTQKKKVGGGVP